MDTKTPSRRAFIAATAKLASAAWLAANWTQIAAAAEMPGMDMHHTLNAQEASEHTSVTTLTPAEAAEVDAIADMIIPGGATPGARDAKCVLFIDNALGSFFAAQLPAFRAGLADFNTGFGAGKFSAAPEAEKTAYLHKVEKTPFFTAVRRLTILGIVSWPKYGGNFNELGWKMMNVENRHVWTPPFGYYDKDYAGFVPYPGTKIQSA